MTVYVDEPIFPYRGQKYCHMYSPDIAELHTMADKIGLKRTWFQNKHGNNFPHYDLAPSKRAAAIEEGATAVTCRDMVRLVRMGLENPSVVSTQLPLEGEPLDAGTTTTTNDWGYGK